MKYKFEKAEKNSVKIHITLDAKEWQSAREDAYNKNKGQYSMQGFRKGKVPMKVLENAYGPGIFFEDAINGAFPKYYGEVLDKEPSIEVIAQPDLDIKKIDEKGITMEAIVAVKPEVVLGDSVSFGIIFLLTVIPISSNLFCASKPVILNDFLLMNTLRLILSFYL